MPRPVALLVNPVAGGGRALKALPDVEARLTELGVPFRVEHTRSLAHACVLADRAANDGEVVATLSGDGTIGAVAGVLRGREDAVLGVLPGGRGNDFCRSLGLPRDPVRACDVLASGVARPIDLGEVDGHVFVGIASVGFDSEANRRANEASPRLGRFVYAYGAMQALVRWRSVTFDVTVDHEEWSFTGWTVAAANAASYGGGMKLAPDARLDDGLLDLVFVAPRGHGQFIRSLPKVYRGTHLALDGVRVVRASEVRIRGERHTVYADGDPAGMLPVTIRAVPGAIRVLLPA